MSGDEISIRIYTICDVRSWIENSVDNGLSSNLISNARALALVHNPYAKPDMPALAVAYYENNPVGYTAVVADCYKGENIYFGTTGYIDASMRGKGVGTKLYSAMMVAANGRWFATDSAPAALTISKKTGLGINYYERYYLSWRKSNSLLSRLRYRYVKHCNNNVLASINPQVQIEVLREVDKKTYEFILQNADANVFNRSREMYNWMLQWPFKVQAPIDLAKDSTYDFTTTIEQYGIYAFRILQQGKIIGFAMLRLSNRILSLLYLYTEHEYKIFVYDMIIGHVLRNNVEQFRTFDSDLINRFNQLGAKSMNSKSRTHKVSLSYPADMSISNDLQLQCGDGDMFA